jgi:hypothetical protein
MDSRQALVCHTRNIPKPLQVMTARMRTLNSSVIKNKILLLLLESQKNKPKQSLVAPNKHLNMNSLKELCKLSLMKKSKMMNLN